jgi:hypothetical protein
MFVKAYRQTAAQTEVQTAVILGMPEPVANHSSNCSPYRCLKQFQGDAKPTSLASGFHLCTFTHFRSGVRVLNPPTS